MTEKKKQAITILLPIMVCMICMMSLTVLGIKEYSKNAYEQISGFCRFMIEKDPESEQQVLSFLKGYYLEGVKEREDIDLLEEYGYRSNDFSKESVGKVFGFSFAAFLLTALVFMSALGYWNRRSKKRIRELTDYLEEINYGTGGSIVPFKEDEFSHLQDEIYKTVTELYQTREGAVKAKINFADNLANIAHQLKTPITAAFLSLRLAQQSAPNIYIERIKSQLERLSGLEESLLTLSKIDAGVLYLEKKPVDVYTVLNLAAENLNELLSKEKITVSIPDKGNVEISGDMEWTMEAFINLMKNCMEHSAEEGVIYCDYSENPLYTEILIWDEGPGFDEKELPYLFDRFYRGKKAEKKGMGIGLSLARSVIELQNGNVTARNLPEGGACFEIRMYKN